MELSESAESELLRILFGLEMADYPSLYEQIFTFLSPSWENHQKSNVVVQAITAVSQDILRLVKNGSTVVNAVPPQIVKDGISKVFMKRISLFPAVLAATEECHPPQHHVFKMVMSSNDFTNNLDNKL